MTIATAAYPAKQKYVGKIAQEYVAGRKVSANWDWEQAQVKAWVMTRPAGSSLLDVPFGTGRYVPFYHQAGLEIFGVDISADMIAAAAASLGPDFEGCHAQVGDAENLPFKDGAFDAVLSGRFIQWLPTIEVVDRVLSEFARVARSELLLQLKIPAGAMRKIEPLPVRLRKWATKPFTSASRLWRRVTKHPSMNIQTFNHSESAVLERAERYGWKLVSIGRECPTSPGVRFYVLRKSA